MTGTLSHRSEIGHTGSAPQGIGAVVPHQPLAVAASTITHQTPNGHTLSQVCRELAERSGIPYPVIMGLLHFVDLLRIKGVGPEYAQLLESAGVDSVQELSQRKAESLHEEIKAINAQKRLVRRLPGLGQVSGWIEQARAMPVVGSGGGPWPKRPTLRRFAAPHVEGIGQTYGARLLAEVTDDVIKEYLRRKMPTSMETGPVGPITRYGRLDFPGQVPLQQRCKLTVTVNRQKLEGAPGQVELGLTAVKWPLQVVATVKVRPEDFLVEGPSHGAIEVPRDADSAPLTFILVPLSLGDKTIRVKFEQNNTYLNTAFITCQVVAIDAAPAGTAEVEGAPAIVTETLPPDVTIYIDQTGDLIYTVSVRRRGDAAGEPAQVVDRIRFPKPPDQYMEAIFADLDAKTKTGLTPAEYDAEVKKIGNNLYDDLFHDEGFKAFYWEQMVLMPEGTAVQIVSEEPWIPWEILRPFRQMADGTWESDPLYLCERFALSRWLEVKGPGPAIRLPMHDITVVAPPSNLPFVKDEVEALEQFPDWRLQTIQDKAALEEFFQNRQANIVHFACHGKFQQEIPDRSVILLGDKRLSPKDLTAEYRNFARVQPLVFLNACDSGRQGLGLTGADGWATAFLEAQVGVFVGSVWKTTDRLASLFATTFYSRLQAGETVGEAVRRARKAVKRAGDATYLSYTLYANPLLKAALAE